MQKVIDNICQTNKIKTGKGFADYYLLSRWTKHSKKKIQVLSYPARAIEAKTPAAIYD